MAELTPETSHNPVVLRHLLDNWRQQAATAGYRRERDKGTTFERLCIAYLQHDPIQARQYEQPMLYSDWAQAPERRDDRVAEPLGFYAEPVRSAQDLGIDLVAKLRDEDGWCAIQCKFHAVGSRIAKAEIDSFLAASGHRDFRQRLIIDTTGREWSTQAEEMLRNQAVPVRRIGLQELQASPIRWQDFATSGEIHFAEQRKLLPHQRKAMEAVTGGLAELGSRGKMIMACGTGKTLTSLRIAEQLAGTGGRVLYLVPSLALMAQTVREWAIDAKIPLRSFAVCSDSQVGKRRRRNDDLIDMDALDLAFPATTDAVRLATVAAPPAPDALTVVFATYQSSPVIEEAQKVHGVPAFDLTVCDEAHRTAGALIEGEDPSHFVRIHSDKYIRCDRRLYMTATPKVYAASARTRAGKLAAALCSMEDERIYGPLLYELTFGAAVDQGLLTDYKVIVLTVPEDAAARAIQRSLAEDGELKLDDGAKLLGCWRALAKVDADQFPENDRAGMRRAISFCRDIKSSQQVERLFARVAEEYREQEGTHLAEYPVAAQHVDGTFNAIRRSVALNWLDEADANGGCRVLTNARCLSEGVDVPALDAILFMHPRKSQIDVVQAVGRVMRKAPGKQMGYIVLPVVISSLTQPEAALNDNKAFEVVWQTLNAIRSHDERFEGMINRIELGEPGDRIGLVTLADWGPAATRTGDGPGIGKGEARDPDTTRTRPEDSQPTLFDGLPEAIRAKIVEKCGDRKYWDEWASDVADIARRHIERITALVEFGDAEREIFQDFVTELRDDLNEGITDADAIEMLAQHSVTGPVFDALFGETEFVSRNPVSQGIQDVLDVLRPANIDAEAVNLDGFYASVRRRVAGAATDKAKQKIVVELYDKFFRNAFPSMTQRLGIVYTPVEIVDFIIHSVNDVLEDEFGTTLGSEGVHILDPFTGTGTFVTRLLQSGLIAPEDLSRKYAHEIHANEIVLLAYYIAAVNIETAYHEITGGDYKPFEGICLADTFEMQEGDDLLAQIMPDNSGRRTRQKETDIRVIVGNPPWSVGQRSQNDNAANQKYPVLDKRIEESYARHSRAQLKNALYDSYIRAIRWASDRIGESGVIGLVTNAGWVDGIAMDGMRKCLTEEFSSLYIFHLRGNQRTQGEFSRREGGKVFGSGSRAPVAIAVFVKNPKAKKQGRILFRDIGDCLDQKAKLKAVRQFGSIRGITQADGWSQIVPDVKYDWIGQGDKEFNQFTTMGNKKSVNQARGRLFRNYSRAVLTCRDAWCFNFSSGLLKENIRSMIDFYHLEIERLRSKQPDNSKLDSSQFVDNDPKKISWSSSLLSSYQRKIPINFDKNRIVPSIYRPFTRQWLYFSSSVNDRIGQMPQIFPHTDAKNRLICVTGVGSRSFSVLMVDALPESAVVEKGQCFPLHLYEKPDNDDDLFGQQPDATDAHGYTCRDAITDDALAKFRAAYGNAVSKHDIFHYIYGLLHVPAYRHRFANNLSKELPRIPLAADPDHFTALVSAGRELGDLHVGFDRVDPWPLEFANDSRDAPTGTDPTTYFRVQKMKLGGTQKEPDLTTIIYNSNITVIGIPENAWDYEVNGKPALKWVMERQAVSTDKASGIVNDANRYATETIGDPSYPLELLACVIRVSMETNRIVEGLPEPEWIEERK
ncbi:MAG: DEAD/DEAH box helicase [Gemmatimonadetes bacterium]|nr:DEAD/DEAH box helicase [Gemmatimonadota bacterium]